MASIGQAFISIIVLQYLVAIFRQGGHFQRGTRDFRNVFANIFRSVLSFR
jgi:hypothetical protein